MRLRDGAFALVVLTGGASGTYLALAAPSPAPRPQPVAGPAPAPRQQQPSIQDVNDRFVRELSERLGDRKDQPSHVVFKNITLKWFKNVPATQLLDIMDGGYAKALGVRCTHCHVA